MNPLMIWDVTRFELSRSMTLGRIAIWIVLVMFPVSLVTTIRVLEPSDQDRYWGLTLYYLIPQLVCLLGLLLWATSAISTEIEGQTWIYLAMRRSGRSIVLLGKYLTAVLWTYSAALVAITTCVFVIGPSGNFRLWWVMCGLAALSCLAYGALYLVIGMLFFRRTMVTAVFYTLLVEYALSFVPAFACKLTVSFRLRELLVNGMDWETRTGVFSEYGTFGDQPVSIHLLVLGFYTVLLLGLGVCRLNFSEFPTQQEG